MLRDKFQKGVENLPHKNSMDGEERLLSLQNMQTSKRDLTDRLSTTHWLRDDEVAVCLVVELCGNGDLADFIKKAKSKIFETGKHPVAEADVLKWAAQCAQALQYIHESGFCHRDIKPTNIFFDEQQNVKLGDFGLATTVGLGRRSAVGTPQYLAPELLLNEVYDGKIDVWGLGAVLLELLTMEERNVNAMVLNNPKCVDDLVKKITRYGFSEKLSNLVKDTLQRHADKRPTAAAILTRIRQMQMAASPSSLGLSMSFGGMSCPKLGEQKCDWCEERIATIICPSCKAIYCAECDIVGHRHHARKSHERTSLQQSGSDSQSTVSRGRPSPSERSVSNASSGRRYSLGMTCNNLSVSDFSITHTLTRSSVAESSIVRVPRDFDTLDLAVSRVASMPEVRKIIVAGGTVINTPLKLTQSLPENIKIIGENPSPVIEVQGEPFVIHCASGKGVIENFIIRHTGRGRTALKAVEPNSAVQAEKNAKTPHPNAVCITGGEWWLHKCRISCIEGSGVSVGSNALNSTAENTKIRWKR
ncbi:protein kinase [Angomonas deanei]|uniref:non-specific serine/threonine protein kinase n=1 Tax=Angomonas deanei TaxID=59799 RepID=A0A7G2CGB2_9TRYP|nr:protein kinase [Angomonas deanei]CAD2218067.1 Protein kinase domain/Protein tyrosine kinase, putative [Angomonas deanei]|eukprot:EPY31581.1 protein kinase [Angomonas deanei]